MNFWRNGVGLECMFFIPRSVELWALHYVPNRPPRAAASFNIAHALDAGLPHCFIRASWTRASDARRSALSHHMTHDELVAKAIELLRQIEPKLPDHIRRVTVDQLPKWRLRDAVVIDFSSDEDLGRIEVMMECDTGDLIAVSHAPPGQEADGGWLRSSSV